MLHGRRNKVSIALAVPLVAWALHMAGAEAVVDPVVEAVQFEQKLNAQIPLDLSFRDSTGSTLVLRDLFERGKPVILTIVYYECPSICNEVLNGLVMTLKEIPYLVDKDYTIVTVSFDHQETHVLAAGKKAAYIESLGRDGAERDWHFLVGEENAIAKLCDAVGFGFQYVAAADEFAHRSGILVATEDGVVSRMLPGMIYEPHTLRLSLADASKGTIGTLVDRIALLCYHYDPAIGRYSLAIMNIVRAGCFLVVAALGILLFAHFRWEKRRVRQAAATSMAAAASRSGIGT